MQGTDDCGGREWDLRLPPRLFATDRFPSKRLNVYSRIKTLLVVRDLLRGTPEWDVVVQSCFGKLFELPLNRCSVSCKLIHAILTRQVVTKKKYSMWSVFGGYPFRFALDDYARVTGLPCGEFPEGYDCESQVLNKDISDAYWSKLVGLPRQATLADIVQMMRSSKVMSGWRRIRLALLLIVDGVLVASCQSLKPTPKYVKMTENVHEFLEFPWGRESFLWTVSCMIPVKTKSGKSEDPVGAFCQQLKQESFRLVGFPLALQLVAFEAIPLLTSKLSAAQNGQRLVDFPGTKLPPKSLSATDVLEIEGREDLAVTPLVGRGPRDDEWDEEVRDRKVILMEDLIGKGHRFCKSVWPEGDATCPTLSEERGTQVGEKRKASQRNQTGGKRARWEDSSPGRESIVERKLDLLIDSVNSLANKMKQVEELSHRLDHLSDEVGKFARAQGPCGLRRRMKDAGCFAKPVENSNPKGCVGPGLLKSRYKRRHAGDVDRGQPRRSPYGAHDGNAGHARGDGGAKDDPGDADAAAATDKNDHVPPPFELVDERGDGLSSKLDSVEGGMDDLGVNRLVEQNPEEKDEQRDECYGKVDGIEGEVDDLGVNRLVDQNPEEMDEERDECYGKLDGIGGDVDALGVNGLVDQNPEERDEQRGECYEKELQSTTDLLAEEPLEKGVHVFVGSDVANSGGVYAKETEEVVERSKTDLVADVGGAGDVLYGEQEGSFRGTPVFPLTQERPCVDDTLRLDEREDCMVDEYLIDDMAGVSAISKSVMEEHGDGSEVTEGLKTPPRPPSVEIEDRDSDIGEQGSNETVDLSDSSPAKPVVPHIPSALEVELACPLRDPSLFGMDVVVPLHVGVVFDCFVKTLKAHAKVLHRTARGFEFDNNFLLTLAGRQQWITTTHMEVLMAYLGGKHREVLSAQRLCFASPWLTSHIEGKHRSFDKAINKDMLGFDEKMKHFVCLPGCTWGEDVDMVYAPMVWAASHWVGLCINLELWSVEILDPNPVVDDVTVAQYMKPIVEMLPYIVRRLCSSNASQRYGMKPFTWTRIGGLYENTRTGDCGPVSAKFMELHALGDPAPGMEGLTDDIIDNCRKQYVMELYRELVIPVYE